jgi:hypothetical protein
LTIPGERQIIEPLSTGEVGVMKKLFLVPAVALCLALVPAASGNTGPQCGDVITSSVVLSADLVCSGNGLTVPATAPLTLDLNGHAVIGSGIGTGLSLTTSGSARLVVKNGSVRGFQQGITLDSGNPFGPSGSAWLERLTIRDNGIGFIGGPDGFTGPDTTFAHSTITHNRLDGVSIAFIRPFRMIDDRVTENGGNGIFAADESLTLLQSSFIARNNFDGAHIFRSLPAVIGNTFLHNGGTGLSIADDLICASPPGPPYTVSNNVARENGGGGMIESAFIPDPCVLPPAPGRGNIAKNNAVFQCIVIVCNE